MNKSDKIMLKNGFTIMELLVAITIGVFLIGAMSKLFLNSKSSIRAQNNTAKMVDDSNFSFFLMQNDISGAGFRGCNSGVVAKVVKESFFNTSGVSNYLTKTNFMEGSQGTGSSFSPALDSSVSALSPAPNPQMDVLTVRTANSDVGVLTSDQANASDPLVVSNSPLVANDIGLISNCAASNLFKVSSVTNGNIVPTSATGTTFPTGAQVYKYNTIVYYVGSDNNLYKSVNNTSSVVLAYNVEKFSVMYGINSDGTTDGVNSYVFANSVTDFSKVFAVRIGIVLKGSDNNTTGTAKSAYSYKFNGATITPNDGKIRKIFYTTITLRNMVS